MRLASCGAARAQPCVGTAEAKVSILYIAWGEFADFYQALAINPGLFHQSLVFPALYSIFKNEGRLLDYLSN